MKSLNKFILFIVFTILIISVPYSFSLKSYDITNDKKFTLSKATISTIKKLNNPVKIDVFLEGSMPNYYYGFQNQIKETIKLFMNENALISYNFINPYNLNQKDLVFKKMADYGLNPEIIIRNTNNNRKEYKVFPWAIISNNYK